MVSQSISGNKKLSNIVLAGVVFTICSVLIGALWLLFSYKNVVNMRAEYAALKDSVARLQRQALKVQPMQPDIAVNTPPANSLPKANTTSQKDTTITVANNASLKAIQPAGKVEQKNTADAIKTVSRSNIILAYYERQADNQNLESTLRSLGYSFDVRKLDKTTGYQKTNCIWFGAAVPLAEVKRVAIAMIQSGNPVKGIKRFPISVKKPSYKRNVIEVGMDQKLENYYSRPLSIVEVERAKSFR